MAHQAHVHSLPILMLAIIVIALSVLDYGRYARLSDPGNFRACLFGDIKRIKPSTDGLAHIANLPLQPRQTPNISAYYQPTYDSIGGQAQLEFLVDASNYGDSAQ